MGKFCSKCGMEIDESTAFCSNCGAKIESVNMPMNGSENTSEYLPKKKNNKTVGIVACILVAVAVIIGLGSLVKAIFFAGDYEDVARKYAIAVANYDLQKAYDYAIIDIEEYFDDYVKYYCDDEDMSKSEFYEEFEDEFEYDGTIKSYKDILECMSSKMKEYLEDEYGDYKVSVKVVDSNELTRRELSDAIEDLREYFEDMAYPYEDELDFDDYIDENKIKKGYEVDVKMTIDGEDDYDSDTATLTVVKYKGKWKVLDPIDIDG